MSEETVVLQTDKVFRWDGPKRKQTLLKAKLGRLVLTDRHLVFLSTGKNDLSVGKLLGAGVSPIIGLHTSSTAALDMAAVHAEGGMSVPVERIQSAQLKGMFKTLTVAWTDEDGSERAATFAPKNGGMPDGAAWVAAIDQARLGGTSTAG